MVFGLFRGTERCRLQIVLVTTMVYDGPIPPRGIFDDFLNMTSLRLDVKERSFVDLINSMPSKVTPRSVDTFFNYPPSGTELITSLESYLTISRCPTIPNIPSIVSSKN